MMAAVTARSGQRSRRASATCRAARSDWSEACRSSGLRRSASAWASASGGGAGRARSARERVVSRGSPRGRCRSRLIASSRVPASASRAQRRCRSRLRSSCARRRSDCAPSPGLVADPGEPLRLLPERLQPREERQPVPGQEEVEVGAPHLGLGGEPGPRGAAPRRAASRPPPRRTGGRACRARGCGCVTMTCQ